jgi:hypothetical protein
LVQGATLPEQLVSETEATVRIMKQHAAKLDGRPTGVDVEVGVGKQKRLDFVLVDRRRQSFAGDEVLRKEGGVQRR